MSHLYVLLTSRSTAKAVVNMSDQPPGTASKLKVIGNVLIVSLIEAVAEAHVLAEKSGLSPAYIDQTIRSVWPGPMAIYSDRMVSGAYYKDKVSILLATTEIQSPS